MTSKKIVKQLLKNAQAVSQASGYYGRHVPKQATTQYKAAKLIQRLEKELKQYRDDSST